MFSDMKIFLPFSLLLLVVSAVDQTRDPALDASLKEAATNLDRQALLPNDSDWTFDFNAQPGYTYSPGSVVNANAATFPATVGQGMTLAMLNLGPCAMLAPHLHPRAANFVVAVAGTTNTYMIAENGAKTISQTLTPGKMTIFPTGSIHTMQNMGCTNATLVSALNSEDTGTTTLANNLFNLPMDIVMAAFGGALPNGSFNTVKGAIPAIGTGSVLGSAECLAACASHGTYKEASS